MPWNTELPIRLLWDCITECQRIGKAGNEQITDKMAMFTALKLLDATGLFSTYTTNWRQANPNQSTWNGVLFRDFFSHADKDRRRNLTTKDAGFHGANATTTDKATDNRSTSKNDDTAFIDPSSNKKIYYCWSHGGCLNSNHTSATCKFQKEGHKQEATWFDMMGGATDMKFGKNSNRGRNRGRTNPGNNNQNTGTHQANHATTDE